MLFRSERMDRPDVDDITGVLPAVAIDQKNQIRSARSTVGTITELNDYLKLLYAHTAELHCDNCDNVVHAEDPAFAAQEVLSRWTDCSVIVAFEFDSEEFGGTELAAAYLRGRGYFRI